jgi:hypothetical protein
MRSVANPADVPGLEHDRQQLGGWKLQSFLNPRLVLDLPYDDGHDHVEIQVDPDNGGNNQRWLFV